MTNPRVGRGANSRLRPPDRSQLPAGVSAATSTRVTSRVQLPAYQPSGFFTFALALYVCVTVGRLHEVVPILTRLYLGKSSAVLLIVALLVESANLPLGPALKTKTTRGIGIITVIALLSVPGSFWPGYSAGFMINVWPLIVLLGVGVLAGFGQARVALVCIACLTVVSATAAAELMLGGGLVTTTNLSASASGAVATRAFIGGGGSTTYDANYSAAFFVMMLPYALMFASRPGRMRWVAIPMVPVLAVAMISTGSRGGIVALAVLLVCTVIFSEKKQRKLQLLFFGLAIGAMLLAPHADLATRLRTLVTGEDYNFDARDGRWAVWRRGISFMIHYPLAGVGVGAFMPANGTMSGSYVDAHNAYVQIAAELGVGGIATFGFMIAHAFKSIWRRRRAIRAAEAPGSSSQQSLESALATAALCSLIAELTAAIFLSMAYEAMTMFALTVPVAIALTKRSAVSANGLRTGLVQRRGGVGARRVATTARPSPQGA